VNESCRRGYVQMMALSGGMALVVGFLFSLGGPWSWPRFAVNTVVSLLYSLAIGFPATFAFDRLKPKLHGRPIIGQWAIYIGVMVVIVLVASGVMGLGLWAVGLVQLDQLWGFYRQGLLVSGVISVPVTIAATALSRMTEKIDMTEARATEARLASLESRVRPHFLFNALNSAIALIPEDPKRAEDVLVRLSGLLRFSLDAHQRVPLREELRVVTDYLEIERVRFADRLAYELDVPAELEDVEVPAFAVQTLVENSVKYAVSPRKQGARIVVRARVDAGRLAITISDDGPGFTGEIWVPGHGLDGLRSRLDALYGARAKLIAPAETTAGAAVRIEIAEAA
jgi:signal transduction histidine kinase